MQSRGEFGLLFHLSIFTSDPLGFAGKQPTLDINNKVDAVGMNRHSNRHAPQREAQVAFKILMTH